MIVCDMNKGGSKTTGDRRPLRRIIKYLTIGIIALVGLIVVLFLLGVIGLPGAELEDNRWGEVENQEVEVITEVGVDNPNPFGSAGEADVEYDLYMQNAKLAEGEASGLEITPEYRTHNFSTVLMTENLPAWWSGHLNDGEVSEVEANVDTDTTIGPLSVSPSTTVGREVDTDIQGALNEATTEFEDEYGFIEIEEATVEWGEVTEQKTEIVTTVTFDNNNPVPMPTPAFAGDIEMNDKHVAEWEGGEVEILDDKNTEIIEGGTIPPGETEERTFVVEMDNTRIAEWFPTHVDRSKPVGNPGVESTEMTFTAQFAVEINGKQITIPLRDRAFACEMHLQTGIIADQDSETSFSGCELRAFEQRLGQFGVIELDGNRLEELSERFQDLPERFQDLADEFQDRLDILPGDDDGEQSLAVETLEPKPILRRKATLRGELTEIEGYDSAEVYFEWGEIGEGLPETTGGKTRIGPFVAVRNLISNLDTCTTYEYRAVAEAGGETVKGDIVEFETGGRFCDSDDGDDDDQSGGNGGDDNGDDDDEQSLNVETLEETVVTRSLARLRGQLTELEGVSSADIYFEWGEKGEDLPETTGGKTRIGTLLPASKIISGLDACTTYEYRAVAEAGGETVKGDIIEFETRGVLC
jgi:LEA14-like dessication related protein